jgi:hypothetical protein
MGNTYLHKVIHTHTLKHAHSEKWRGNDTGEAESHQNSGDKEN